MFFSDSFEVVRFLVEMFKKYLFRKFPNFRSMISGNVILLYYYKNNIFNIYICIYIWELI